MAAFYIINSPDGSTVGCELTLSAAKNTLKEMYDEGGSITRADVDINKETVRRLLGELGGYANDIKTVWER